MDAFNKQKRSTRGYYDDPNWSLLAWVAISSKKKKRFWAMILGLSASCETGPTSTAS